MSDCLPERVAVKRVAVIAVHGVGEHLPGETSGFVVRQLQNSAQGYREFTQTPISIAVDTRDLGLPPATKDDSPWYRRLFAGSAFVRAPVNPYAGQTDLNFTETILRQGHDYRSDYRTSCWSGRNQGTRPADVDVYEMYWSDLSHVGSQALIIFEQLVQLLMHVASLGRTTAATVVGTMQDADIKPSWLWRQFYYFTGASYWLLSMPILIGNLLFVLLGALFIPAMLPVSWLEPAFAAIVGLAAAAAAGGLVYSLLGKDRARPLSVVAVPIAGLAAGFMAWTGDPLPVETFDPAFKLALAEVPLLLLMGDAAMRRYALARPLAAGLWRVMAGALCVWAAGVYWWLWKHGQWDAQLPHWSTLYKMLVPWLGHTVEGLFIFMVAAWVLLHLANLALAVSGLWLAARPGRLAPVQTAAEIRRSIYTCFTAAALPAPFFLAGVLMT